MAEITPAALGLAAMTLLARKRGTGATHALADRMQMQAQRLSQAPGAPLPDEMLSPAELCERRALEASGGDVNDPRFWQVLLAEVKAACAAMRLEQYGRG